MVNFFVFVAMTVVNKKRLQKFKKKLFQLTEALEVNITLFVYIIYDFLLS